MAAIRRDIVAARNETWAPPMRFPYRGPAAPVTGARAVMEVRQYPGETGDPLIRIDPITIVDELMSGTPGAPDELRRLNLSPSISIEALEGLPGLYDAGEAQPFAYDIVLIYADGVRERLCFGSFLTPPGVTRPS